MDIFSARLFSRKEYFQLFLICLLPVNVWAIITFMRRLPTLVLLMSAVHLVGVSAYILAFALLESVIIFGLIFLTSLFLPKSLLGSRLVPIGAIVILIAAISASLVHLYDPWDIEVLKFRSWAGLWALLGMAAAGLLVYGVQRNSKIEDIIKSGVERLSLLSLVYLCADILGVIVILFRNLR